MTTRSNNIVLYIQQQEKHILSAVSENGLAESHFPEIVSKTKNIISKIKDLTIKEVEKDGYKVKCFAVLTYLTNNVHNMKIDDFYTDNEVFYKSYIINDNFY